jgi:hypothetical protein
MFAVVINLWIQLSELAWVECRGFRNVTANLT